MIEITIYPDCGRDAKPYQEQVEKACRETSELFSRMGFVLEELPIKKVVLLTDLHEARKTLAKEFDMPLEKIPATVAGTPKDTTLLMTDETIVYDMFNQLYREYNWDRKTEFYKCLKHEIIHMFHEKVAINEAGSADGMGPIWFFEGLAVQCAEQFPQVEEQPLLEKNEIEEIISDSQTKSVSYIRYRRLMHTLVQRFSLEQLVKAAFNHAELEALIKSL
ncbi:MAG: hypothetical protein ACOYXC_13395 [Candidatus Rifleibacteriota bacterium]